MSDSTQTMEPVEIIAFTYLVTYVYRSDQGLWEYEHQIMDDWASWYLETLARGKLRVEIVNVQPITTEQAKGLKL